ncbi:MAG: hypothetical protein KIH00_08730 [Lachnospiraceae bacterium]|nr:hypothetical protein [Lachnospiraceae bacterium]
MAKQSMKKIFFRKSIAAIFILGLGILLGFLALCLVYMFPVDSMYRNVQHSRDTINSQAELIPGYESTTIDNYTDSIMLNEAICPVDAPLIEKVMYGYQVNYFKQYTQQENLLRYLNGESGYQYQAYPHYWNGHQVVLKPLLLFFDYSDILVISTIVQSLLLAAVIIGLYQTGKKHIILPFLVAVLSIMPTTISRCLQYHDVYYIFMLGCLLIIWKNDKIKAERMYLLFLALGIATSYFDFLTYPFVTLGVPLALMLVYNSKLRFPKQLFYTIQYSVLWCIGYWGMWASKWILGTLLTEENMIARAIISIKYRGSSQVGSRTVSIFEVLLENLFVYLKWPTLLLIGFSGIYLLVKAIKIKSISPKALMPCISYMIICLYPIVWYMISKNHSYEHTFMTYRELAITTFAGLCMLAELGIQSAE